MNGAICRVIISTMKTIRSLVMFFLLISINTTAQQLTTEGKEFWLSFLNNASSTADNKQLHLKIYISAKQNCTGIIQNADGSFIQNFSATAGTVTEIEVSKDFFYTYNNQ